MAPGCDRVDLAHDIPPGDIRWGAILLERLVRLMPRDSVTVAVVDPGVGTNRHAAAVELEWGKVIVGPDNGLLGLAAARHAATRAVSVTPGNASPNSVSDTFHGRDVFAPAGCRIVTGTPLEQIGPAFDPAELIQPQQPGAVARPGTLEAVVVGVDRFGNLALWAGPEDLMATGLADGTRVWVASAEGGRSQATVGRTFADVPRGALLAYVDSHGLVSVALNGGSAEERVRATTGEVIALMRQE